VIVVHPRAVARVPQPQVPSRETLDSVLAIGVDRTRASVETLAALHAKRRGGYADAPLRAGSGLVAVATCHRVEWYLDGVSVDEARQSYDEWFGAASLGDVVLVHQGVEAGRHLLRVAAGLESAVLGEDQILAQVRQGYRDACATRRSSPLLHRLFHCAFRAGRRVRGETNLAAGTRSLAGAAVAVLHRRLCGLRERTILVLGAGDMARLSARLLADRNVGRLIIANRTASRAAALAADYGGESIPWEDRAAMAAAADGVICATGSAVPVLGAETFTRVDAARQRPLVLVDLGVPRNIEPGTAAGIDVLDVDLLDGLLREEAARRVTAVTAAEDIVEDELAAWLAWSESRDQYRARAGCAANR
jgi:glutamyl-tRNA reductase